jgi:hypothetical protein
MKITIENTVFEMTRVQAKELLTENANKLVNRVHHQGGSLKLGIGALAPKYREMIK